MRLELQGAALAYGDHEPLFHDVDLCVEAGQFVVVEGPSGGGKSSLLRLLNRLQEPTAGQLLIDGKPAAELNVSQMRRQVCLVPQTPVTVPGTVGDNLTWPFSFAANRSLRRPLPDDMTSGLAQLRLEGVGLDDDAATLSVGQQQRLALLRALFLHPSILLCDEPTASLDEESRHIVEAELRTRNVTGLSVVMVSHQPVEADSAHTTRCLRLADGTLREQT